MSSKDKKDNHTTTSKELMGNLSFCVFDLETTGGNHKSDKIIEIGLVKIENLKIVKEKEFLINPEIKIPDFIQKLTSIKAKDVSRSPRIQDVIDEILEFMEDSILVAHNTSFDIPFFNSVLRRMSRPKLANKSLCTNLMTKYLIPNLMNSNLSYMSKVFGIPHKKAHRALDDARATGKLLIKYLNIFVTKGINKVNHLYYPRNRYELDRIHFKKKQPIKDITAKLKGIRGPFLITVKGKNGTILFALPCHNSANEKKFLKEKIEQLPWETVTVRLFGLFFNALVHYNGLFDKVDQVTRSESINFLWSEHLKKHVAKKSVARDDTIDPDTSDLGDFIVFNHLVPEQYVIYPLTSLHQNSGLIFRYPAHQKKLLQYITSKAQKIKSNRIRKVHYNPHLKDFIVNFLLTSNSKKSQSNYFLFPRHFPLNNKSEFLIALDDFLNSHPNSYKYPKEYI